MWKNKEQLRHVEKTYASKHTSNIAGILHSKAVITGRLELGQERTMGRQEETAQKQSQELREYLMEQTGSTELTGRRAVSGSGPEHLVLLIRIQLNQLSAVRENYSSTQVSNSK